MSDKFFPTPLKKLLKLVLKSDNQILGIDEALWYKPEEKNILALERFSQKLDTPVGVAAGPHSQLAQNIVASWLCGARYIELKTIQTLDELDVSKPCIDMQDEGYNCEWSQELKVHESFDEYLNAWILIHILNDKLHGSKENGTIFNMSVGYNMEGIMNKNVQWFFDKMQNASAELEAKIEEIKEIYPNVVNLNIPAQVSDNITLSTMHGCPAEEIEEIGLYLINKKKLHTLIKLNPTLLGAEELRNILNNKLGFETVVPDLAFEHDLKYPDSISIIKNLEKAAAEQKVFFGLKLTNTLETNNIKDVFSEDMMYMSGRALHPISINVVRKLQNEFGGRLDISFAGGADAFNVVDILGCGITTVTVSSDLLKPGGYTRLKQYVDNIQTEFSSYKAESLEQYILQKNNASDYKATALKSLNNYADNVTDNKNYKRVRLLSPSIKTERELGNFDCIAAPCMGTCPTNQNIPAYMFHTSRGQYDEAFAAIMQTNPFPNSTGMVCDHLCQTKCSRINYDEPLQIREIKRFVSEQNKEVNFAKVPNFGKVKRAANGLKIGIIGAGASGLSAAYFLALAGFEVNVFEEGEKAGGMVSNAIPSFRLTEIGLEEDIKRITDLGVKIHFKHKVDKSNFETIKTENDYVYISVGAQKSKQLRAKGIDTGNVFEPLQFLFDVKAGRLKDIGKRIGVVGGGNTAMDTVRTANRLAGKDGKAILIYRRSKKQMPAEFEEIQAVIDEGIEILELNSPEEIISENGKIKALRVSKMKLGEKGADGRASIQKIENSEYEIPLDALIPAIGQDLDIDFVDTNLLKLQKDSYQTQIKGVYIGGDAMRGAANLINAVGDGRKMADEIMRDAKLDGKLFTDVVKNPPIKLLKKKKATRRYAEKVEEIKLSERDGFNLIIKSLDEETAKKEASRCLQCDEICDVCVSVCPNLANFAYTIEPVLYKLPEIEQINGEQKTIGHTIFEVKQAHQVLNIRDWCNECANCNTFCPTNGAPYLEKPHVHMSEASYNAEQEGYMMRNLMGKEVLLHKFGEMDEPTIESLTFYNNIYTFENDNYIANFKKENFEFIDVKFKIPHSMKIDFKKAASMSVVLEGARQI